MELSNIADVLNLSTILSAHHEGDAAHNPSLISELIQWRDSTAALVLAPVEDKPKSKRGKATESKDSDDFEPSPDPSDEPDF